MNRGKDGVEESSTLNGPDHEQPTFSQKHRLRTQTKKNIDRRKELPRLGEKKDETTPNVWGWLYSSLSIREGGLF